MHWTDKYRKAFALSYDDGVFQDIRLVEMLNRYGLKATFHLNSGLMHPRSVWYGEGVRVERMPPDRLPQVYQGHEIASHSTLHRNLVTLDSHALYTDIRQDRERLEQLFDCDVTGFSYPYGATDARVKAVLRRCGIQYARTTAATFGFELPSDLLETAPTCRHKDENLFSLTSEFIELRPDEPQFFLLWGHSYELDMQQGWERFERFCEQIAGREDIFYGTCGEVLQGMMPTKGGEGDGSEIAGSHGKIEGGGRHH